MEGGKTLNWLLILYFVIPVILRYLDTATTIVALALPPKLIATENGASLVRLMESNLRAIPFLESWYGNLFLIFIVMVPSLVLYYLRTVVYKSDFINFISDVSIIAIILFTLLPPVINNIRNLIWFLQLTPLPP